MRLLLLFLTSNGQRLREVLQQKIKERSVSRLELEEQFVQGEAKKKKKLKKTCCQCLERSLHRVIPELKLVLQKLVLQKQVVQN